MFHCAFTDINSASAGKYTTEHVTTNLPTDLMWAVADRG